MSTKKSTPRKLSDGTLIFPKRGKPPPAIQGYKRVKGSPFVFKPVVAPCIFRSEVEIKRLCGGFVLCYDCSHFNKVVKMVQCLECEEMK